MPELPNQYSGACALQREKPLQGKAHWLQLKKASHKDPAQPKINKLIKRCVSYRHCIFGFPFLIPSDSLQWFILKCLKLYLHPPPGNSLVRMRFHPGPEMDCGAPRSVTTNCAGQRPLSESRQKFSSGCLPSGHFTGP